MARTTNDGMPANTGLNGFLLLLAASAIVLVLPGTALAQPAASISKVVKRSLAKAASCIVPAPVVTLTPAGGIVFPTPVAQDGCASSPQSFTITNSGNAPLQIGAVSSAPPSVDFPNLFSASGCSNQTLAPGGSCTGSVNFCVGFETGAQSGLLKVFSNAFGSPHSIPLSGTVAAGTPTASFFVSPSSLNFYGQVVGTISAPQTVTISNTGSAPMTVTSATTSPPFAVASNNCGSVLAGASCTIDVTYYAGSAPTAGIVFDALSIVHTAPGSPDTVSLSGESVALPGLTIVALPPLTPSFTSAPLYFNSWDIGLPDVTQVITITNLSLAPFTPSLATLTGTPAGIFSKGVDNCTSVGLPLNPGQSCTIDIVFKTSTAPLGNYAYTLNLGIGVDIFTVPVSGSVIPLYPSIDITPFFWDYGTINVGGSSACQDFIFTNTGTTAATFDVFAPATSAFIAGACNPLPPQCATTGQVLAAGASCHVAYRFVPGVSGQVYDYVYPYDPAFWGYLTPAQLTGNGYQPGPRIALDQFALDFGSQVVGTSAPTQAVTVTNTGESALTLSSRSNPLGAEFSVTDGCAPYPRVLPAGASCTASITFTPGAVQAYSDFLLFSSDALDYPSIYLDLSGAGVALPTPSADFFPMSLAFGNVAVFSSSVPQSISFANTGSAPMTITSIASGGNYTVTHDCPVSPATLAPNVCCTITATFVPTAGGPLPDSILVTTNAAGSPSVIPLSGTGVPPPSLTATPASLSFPDQVVNTTSALFQVVIRNTGITDIVLGGVNYTGDFQAVAPPPPRAAAFDGAKRASKVAAGVKAAAAPACATGTLVVGASCALDAYFTPTALGLRTGIISVAFTGGTGGPMVVPLAGYGVSPNAPGISLSADVLDFGGVTINTGVSRSIVISSTGTGPLDVLGVRALGPYFSVTTDCGIGIAAGRSCSAVVTCQPNALARGDGDLYIDHSATGGFRNVHLTCTGIPVPVPKIRVSATGVGFGNQNLGTASSVTEIQVSSVGTASLQLGSLVASRPFTMTTDCPIALQPGLSCKVKVAFTPVVGGRQAGTLTIPSNDPGVPNWVVNLNGTGCRPFSVQGARRGGGLCSF